MRGYAGSAAPCERRAEGFWANVELYMKDGAHAWFTSLFVLLDPYTVPLSARLGVANVQSMAASLCQGFWDDEQQTCQPAVSTTQTGVSGEDGIDKPSDTKGESTPTRKHDENPVTISASQAHTLPTSSVSFRNTLSNAASTASLTTDPLITSAPAPASAVSGGSGSNGVSKGAAAGIAIATAIVGGAIAFFVAFMLFKRRKRPSAHSFENHSTDFLTSLKGGNSPYVQVSQVIAPPPVAAAAIPRKRSLDLADLSNSSDFLAGILPPAADEQTVKDKVAALFSQVLQHVDNFYRDVQATLTPSMEVDLKKFGSESVNLAEILGLSSAPTVAIKHALMGYILSIVSPAAEPQSTLFPVEVAGLRDDERLTESPGQNHRDGTQK